MTDGPGATVGEVYSVPFARPRARAAVLADGRYQAARRGVVNFLGHQARQSRPSTLDDVIARMPAGAH